jgi:hypothetical protein
VNRALWLLLGLRLKGWLRRYGRNLKSAKGIALTVVGLVVFVPWVLTNLLVRLPTGPQHLAEVRKIGPLILLAYCIFTVLMASGERAISFSPAEVNLLFPAPFSRRQLLAFKISASTGLCLLSALFMTVFLGQHAASFLAGYVGLVLALELMQLFAMAVALVTANLGAVAMSWRRRAVLALVVVVLAGALWEVGLKEALQLDRQVLLARLESATAARVLLAPFRWIMLAFTAERIWPDLVKWAALGLLTDMALVVFVLALDAQYLELSAAASERVYARLERMRRGGAAGLVGSRRTGKARACLPMFPAWGGAGPLAWRQATTASRDVARLISVVLMFGAFSVPAIFASGMQKSNPELALTFEGIVLAMTLMITPAVPFDFRADLDRMAELKALPVRPAWLVVGQVFTPVCLITCLQAIALGAIAAVVGGSAARFWAIASFAVPVNALLFELDNLIFLWFPTRLGPTTPGDIQNIGRVVLLMFAKVILLGVAGGLAALVALLVYLVSGSSWTATFCTAWLVLAATAVALVPLVALAFTQFDVARDTPL